MRFMLALGLVLGMTTGARAQQGDSARQLFRQGVGAFDEGDYGAALTAFEQSYRARPVPSVLFNIARTLQALRRYADAVQTYERYLREEMSVPAERRRLVRAEIERLTRLLGGLELRVTPTSATVRIDGREQSAGTIALAPGEHLVEVSAPGYATDRRQVAIVAGRRVELAIDLSPQSDPARLLVDSAPAGAALAIDGEPRGTTPWSGELAPGAHRLLLSLVGYADRAEEIRLAAGQERRLEIALADAEEVYESAWFWGLLGGAAVAGLAVALVLALYQPPSLAGNFDPPIVTALFEWDGPR